MRIDGQDLELALSAERDKLSRLVGNVAMQRTGDSHNGDMLRELVSCWLRCAVLDVRLLVYRVCSRKGV